MISNSSPLIHLSKIGRLHLLRNLFQEILVPEEVLLESTENSNGAPDADDIKQASWIHAIKIEDTDLKRALMLMLDEGEAASIVLALEQKADLVILDDYDGRAAAKEYRLNVTGTIGILLRAKLTGKIYSLRQELDSLKDSGFWLSEELYQRVWRRQRSKKKRVRNRYALLFLLESHN